MSVLVTPVIGDLIPRSRVRDVALVGGGTTLLAAASQILIPLWFTPVPLSLATFAVILVGSALGALRALASTGLYLLLGVVGLPVFAGFSSGVDSASFGYVIGYVLAAVAAGHFARRAADRRAWSTLLLAIASTTLVYAAGLPWLMVALGVGLKEGLALGVFPFLLGDALKAAAAAGALPLVWRLVGSAHSS